MTRPRLTDVELAVKHAEYDAWMAQHGGAQLDREIWIVTWIIGGIAAFCVLVLVGVFW